MRLQSGLSAISSLLLQDLSSVMGVYTYVLRHKRVVKAIYAFLQIA